MQHTEMYRSTYSSWWILHLPTHQRLRETWLQGLHLSLDHSIPRYSLTSYSLTATPKTGTNYPPNPTYLCMRMEAMLYPSLNLCLHFPRPFSPKVSYLCGNRLNIDIVR
ncbi:hypothetical protein QCA50_008275 [Cerrena zonata]|uniref:Uncharacterized protein n=1 Tax=Cerrena zonata TaxID=2478898 RepID=A0AAW0G7S0_9APHY